MQKIHYIFIGILFPLILVSLLGYILVAESKQNDLEYPSVLEAPTITEKPTSIPTKIPTPTAKLPPASYEITIRKHMFQTFNNCGPASLSMLLSYHDIDVSQQTLGSILRPLQNPQGNNDDKSVSLAELADHAQNEYGLIAYHRASGDLDMLKRFVSNDIPIVVRTWLNQGEDIGHYRLVRGYDDNRRVIIQDDSYQGKDLEYSYELFDQLWMPFSWEFLVLVPPQKTVTAESILGIITDPDDAWEEVVERSIQNADDYESGFTIFNRSRANYYLGDYATSIELYEQVEPQLPFRMLWYQYEPIQAYLQLGQYERVFTLTSQILDNHNRGYSELYILRGKAYEAQGDKDRARLEYEKAVLYNKNLEEPKLLLERIGDG